MNNQTQEALKMAGYDLDGVIADVEKFNGFDDACLQTIKRVRSTIAEALEQPAQEPVEVYGILDDGDYVAVEATKEGAIKQCEFMNKHDCNCTYKPLYTRHTPAQEPYGWYDNHDIHNEKQSDESIALYTHPHQWQGLTDDEIREIIVKEGIPVKTGNTAVRFAHVIEQVLSIKD